MSPLQPKPPPPELDYDQLADSIIARLDPLTVIYEGGDEPHEHQRTITVPINGGTITIPAAQLQIRNVDIHGNQIGELYKDSAPLGLPLKFKNKLGASNARSAN